MIGGSPVPSTPCSRSALLFFCSLFFFSFLFCDLFPPLSLSLYMEEEECSVSSPRRILSFSKRRWEAGFQDSDSRTSSGFGVSGEHGPKPSEVYGFVGSISTVVATVIFLVWAYVPENWLDSVGIHYYPSRYWAIAIPTYVMVTVVLALVFYIGLNFMSTPPPTSLNTLFDEYSREPGDFIPLTEEEQDRPIEPISDLDITKINELMFNSYHAK